MSTMQRVSKRVASVEPVPSGDETVSDLLAGATVIELANSGDFYEDGGHVRIDGNIYVYTSVEEGEDDDSDPPSITLDSGLVDDLPAGSVVEVWNPNAKDGAGDVVVEWTVEVTDDTDGSPATALLAHSLIPLVSEGLAVGVGDSVTVEIDDDTGDWTVVDLHGRTAAVGPEFIRTGGLGADTVVWAGTENGRRAQLDGIDGALEVFDSTNTQTVNLDGDANYMQGSIATAADGSRVEVGQGSAFGLPAEETRFYTGDSGEVAPAKITSSVSPVDGGMGLVTISAAEWDAAVPSGDPARLQLLSDSANNLFNTAALLSGAALQILATAGKVDLGAVGDKVYISSSSGVKVTGALEATMGAGSVGTGAFRDSVDARADARIAALAVPLLRTANVQTGTSYTIALSDGGGIVDISNSGTHTLTVPANATTAFPVGTEIEVFRRGVGAVNIAAAGGVSIESKGGFLAISHRYGVVRLRKRNTDIWVLWGDLA